MNTSKAFQTIVSIIKVSAENGLTLTEALPDILAVNVGRIDGNVNFRNSNGNEIYAYSNIAHALQVALKAKQTTFDEEPTLNHLLNEAGAFSVTVASKHGRLHYDMFCDGINTTLEDLLTIDDWLHNVSEYIYVNHKGKWKTGADIEYESKMDY
jgi:hypothetical protein